MVPLLQKYHIVKQLFGQLLVYFMALLVVICITLCLLLLVIVRGFLGHESSTFYFCFSVVIKMDLNNAQLDSHRQTIVSWVCLNGLWSFCSGTWYGLLKPILTRCSRSKPSLTFNSLDVNISPKVFRYLLINQSVLPSIIVYCRLDVLKVCL